MKDKKIKLNLPKQRNLLVPLAMARKAGSHRNLKRKSLEKSEFKKCFKKGMFD